MISISQINTEVRLGKVTLYEAMHIDFYTDISREIVWADWLMIKGSILQEMALKAVINANFPAILPLTCH